MKGTKKLINKFESTNYLSLIKKCLTRLIFENRYEQLHTYFPIVEFVQKILNLAGLELVKKNSFNPELRLTGKDWPMEAETMIGLYRLNNIEKCMVSILKHNIPGDFIETGVWRGGATIFMRAVLKQYNINNRIVWVADSFRGLPKPDPLLYKQDRNDIHWKFNRLAIPLHEVRANFSKYDLLDKQVRFLPGWFKDTLPKAPIKRLSLIRLDGDMYGSTMDALTALYPILSPGGFIIVDDYSLPNCRAAVNDFRNLLGIKDKIHKIDWTGVYWQRS